MVIVENILIRKTKKMLKEYESYGTKDYLGKWQNMLYMKIGGIAESPNLAAKTDEIRKLMVRISIEQLRLQDLVDKIGLAESIVRRSIEEKYRKHPVLRKIFGRLYGSKLILHIEMLQMLEKDYKEAQLISRLFFNELNATLERCSSAE
jgi:hypothetical protein